MDEVHALKRFASSPASSRPRTTCSTGNSWAPEVFDQITDILAEMGLEDLKRFPHIPTGSRIDRCCGLENTVLLTQEGGE